MELGEILRRVVIGAPAPRGGTAIPIAEAWTVRSPIGAPVGEAAGLTASVAAGIQQPRSVSLCFLDYFSIHTSVV